jgi:hypothetical protein
MPEWSWPNGGSTTTPSGHTVVWAICRQPITPSSAPRHRNGTDRCAQLGAPRPAPLPHRAGQAQMTNRLYSSLDDKRGSDQWLRVAPPGISPVCREVSSRARTADSDRSSIARFRRLRRAAASSSVRSSRMPGNNARTPRCPRCQAPQIRTLSAGPFFLPRGASDEAPAYSGKIGVRGARSRKLAPPLGNCG